MLFNHIVTFCKKYINFYVFLENVFSYLVLWLLIGDKVFWVRCTFEEFAEKTKGQKMNVNFLQPN